MTQTHPPDLPNLADYLAWYARETPQADAAITGAERLSYRQLAALVEDCASAMVAIGVEHGDRVACLSTPGAAFWVSLLAAASIGAIWCGLNPRHTSAELDRVIARLEPRLVLARQVIDDRDYGEWIAALPASVNTIRLAGAEAAALAEFCRAHVSDTASLRRAAQAVASDDICLIVFTSGTSGEPKGVMMSHHALVGASRVQVGQWTAKPLRVLNNLPINHIGAVGDLACYALVGGGATVFCERFSPEASLTLIEQEKITVLGQVPTQLELTLRSEAFRAEALQSLQLMFWGGAQASVDLVRRLLVLNIPIATSYGQTETVGSVTFTESGTPPDILPLTVGTPVAPYALRVVDDAGQEQQIGVGGEILVRSPYAMSGYWRAPAASAAAYTLDGWLRTGDVGTLDADHRLRLTGRTSEVFKSGGYNIYPAEIEAALLACSAVGPRRGRLHS
jgi:acyl-CoA synthetase (AMP-forming)/AMP-acid ligase II